MLPSAVSVPVDAPTIKAYVLSDLKHAITGSEHNFVLTD
jgi:hypothetical protein